jgi:hypothetical protein
MAPEEAAPGEIVAHAARVATNMQAPTERSAFFTVTILVDPLERAARKLSLRHAKDAAAARPVIMERPARVTKSWVTLLTARQGMQSHMVKGADLWPRIHDL